MLKRKKRLALLFLGLPLVLTIFLSSQPAEAQATHYWRFPSNFIWKLRAYDTYVKFSGDLYCDKIGYDVYPDNTKWYWLNPYMDAGLSGWWWIGSQYANVTVQQFFAENTLQLYVQISDVATVQFYSPWGEPYSVVGALWQYTDNIVQLTKGASGTVTISWNPPEEEPEHIMTVFQPDYTMLRQYWMSGDLSGYLIAVYASVLGSVQLFGGILLAGFSIGAYMRWRNLTFMSLLWLIGGAFLTSLIPYLFFSVAWFFIAGGIIVLLYRLFHGGPT